MEDSSQVESEPCWYKCFPKVLRDGSVTRRIIVSNALWAMPIDLMQ